MNTEEFINWLKEQRFNDKQINQLVIIKEANYDLENIYNRHKNKNINSFDDYITSKDSIEKLRQLKDILINDKFDTYQLLEILNGYKNDIDYKIYADSKYN
jgi:hypothetical protein